MERIFFCGWITLLFAMAGDFIFSYLLSFFYKGYSNMKMSISALGNPKSPVRIPFNIWMLIEGLLFLSALPALYKNYHSVSAILTTTTIVFIAIFAIGSCIFTCFFSVNESKTISTTSSKIHGAGSALGFTLFYIVPLLVAILSFRCGENIFGAVCMFCFASSLVFFALFVMSDKEKFSGTLISNEGLWQRLNLFFMYLPLAILAVRKIAGF